MNYLTGRTIKLKALYYLLVIGSFSFLGCDKDEDLNNLKAAEESSTSKTQADNVSVSSIEDGASIYIDGFYTGETTPSTLNLPIGEHVIGVGLNNSERYLRKTINVTSTEGLLEVSLNEDDLQQPKKWKALFVGFNNATNGSCTTTYSREELQLGYDFFTDTFQEYLEPYSYNTMEWEFEKCFLGAPVRLSNDNLVTPPVFDAISEVNINPGDYDLIITFFRGQQTDCTIGGFLGIAWFDVNIGNSDASYFTIRYHDDIEGRINWARNNDPGVYIHEWLHTVAESFYPDRGYPAPRIPATREVVHAAGLFNYSFPWMTWYRDLIRGQVNDGGVYKGMGPDALLECTVRENALGQCPN